MSQPIRKIFTIFSIIASVGFLGYELYQIYIHGGLSNPDFWLVLGMFGSIGLIGIAGLRVALRYPKDQGIGYFLLIAITGNLGVAMLTYYGNFVMISDFLVILYLVLAGLSILLLTSILTVGVTEKGWEKIREEKGYLT